MNTGLRIRDFLYCLAYRWKLVLIAAIIGVVLGGVYAFSYASDNDPYPFKGSAKCAVALVEADNESSYSAKSSLLGKWVPSLILSNDVFEAIADDEAVIKALPDASVDERISLVKQCVSFSYETNTSTLTIASKASDGQIAQLLVEAAAGSLQDVINDQLRFELGEAEVKIMSSSLSENTASGSSAKQVVSFGVIGFFVGLAIASLLVLVGDYVTYSSLIERYTLPVFGPFFEKRQKLAKGFSMRETAYAAFPRNAVLVPVGTLHADPEKVVEKVKEALEGESVVQYAVSVDDVLRLAKDGVSVVLAVVDRRTSHGEVAKTVCLLDVYGIRPESFCLLER